VVSLSGDSDPSSTVSFPPKGGDYGVYTAGAPGLGCPDPFTQGCDFNPEGTSQITWAAGAYDLPCGDDAMRISLTISALCIFK